jgi:CRISPR-associated protein (TIGR03984 family)
MLQYDGGARYCQAVGTAGFVGDPVSWLLQQPMLGDEVWLLVHCDDGVIWGKICQNQLLLSGDVFPEASPPLRSLTLRDARLFGELAEVRVWRGASGFNACRIADGGQLDETVLEEEYLLWGTRMKSCRSGFTLVAEGSRGIRQAVPLELESELFQDRQHPLRVQLRHYLACDGDGQVYIAGSRLYGISCKGRNGK